VCPIVILRSDEEKNISENYSSLVNKAYGTLQAPLKRALHLLSLRGEEIEEGQKVDDPEFLMEIMELNEEVESADNAEKLKSLRQKNDVQLTKIAKEIESHFDTDQTAKAKEAIIKMKYYNSVNVYINNLMREGGVVD
jgi:molecular chaperone HscB